MKGPYFSHLFIKVKDLKVIKELFKVLDLKLVYEDGKYFRYQGDNDFYIGVEENQEAILENSNIEINIRVPDLTKVYKNLLDAGYKISSPQQMPWGATHIFFKDKNGIKFSVYSSI